MTSKLTGFYTPAFPDLRNQAKAAYDARLGQGVTTGQGPVSAMPYIDGMLAFGAYGYMNYVAAQTMVLYATGENLDGHGFTYGVPRQPAARASGSVTFTGLTGAALDAGLIVKSASGVQYQVKDGVTLVAGQANATITAIDPGAAGNLAAGSNLTLVSPVAGVDPTCNVGADGLAGGADAEQDGRAGIREFYRGRILDRIRKPPQGGAGYDYEAWAREVPGVTRVWVSPREMGAGTVTVRFMMDVVRADQGGIPQAGDVAIMQDYLDERRPVNADVFAVAPIGVPLDLTVTGLDPDTPAVRQQIAAEFADMLYRRAVPGGNIGLDWIGEAVSVAAGENRHRLTSPTDDIDHTTGQIAIPGVITYD
ncbi:baseplate J/gp47 family protein [Thalassospira marina]|uniref:Baseplate J protein n=1 Tax=Thalassospira marina TaxID=2048283 RepID=A0A2N3KJK0_9PROT|nr:baseplate J/gp47 family protein [Thalassospira marina]PKR50757.1 baseplate J protein [Thalassospira marina]